MTIKEMRRRCNMTQKEFSEYFGFSKRSVESWEGNQRPTPEYLRKLIEYKLRGENMFILKYYFVETNGYNYVAVVDRQGIAYILHETAFGEQLTLDVAKNADYSNFDGCTTAEECYFSVGYGNIDDLTIDFETVKSEAENITEF